MTVIDFLNYAIVSLCVLSAFALLGAYIFTAWRNPAWEEEALKHTEATVGVPFAALAAFIVVTIFRTTDGAIAFSFWTFSFHGASGPIVMWIMCFVSIVWSIRYLWGRRSVTEPSKLDGASERASVVN